MVRFINPDTMPKPPGFTHVVEVSGGKTIYLSGQVPRSPDGVMVGEEDATRQAEQVFANLEAGLAAVGGSFDDVVKLTMFVVDMADFKAIAAVRDTYVNLENPPASSSVEVQRLVTEGMLVEVEAIAVLPA